MAGHNDEVCEPLQRRLAEACPPSSSPGLSLAILNHHIDVISQTHLRSPEIRACALWACAHSSVGQSRPFPYSGEATAPRSPTEEDSLKQRCQKTKDTITFHF